MARLAAILASVRVTGNSIRAGVVMDAVDSNHALVDLGDRSVICLAPSSLGVIAPGQAVRVSIEGNGYTITDIISGASPGSFWQGGIAADYTPTSSNYKSIDVSTFISATGAPDFYPTFSGDCMIPPFAAWWYLQWKVYWSTDSTSGNRQAIIYQNPSSTTWNSASNLSGGSYLDTAKVAASTAETSVTAERRVWLTPSDLVMFVARTTSATQISSGARATRMTMSLIRTIP